MQLTPCDPNNTTTEAIVETSVSVAPSDPNATPLIVNNEQKLELLKGARRVASWGYRIIPVGDARHHKPPYRRKHPLLPSDWQNSPGHPGRATTDTEIIQPWFLDEFPGSNIGIVTGPIGEDADGVGWYLIVIDAESAGSHGFDKDGNPVEGLSAVMRLWNSGPIGDGWLDINGEPGEGNRPLPPTVLTATRGAHFYFRTRYPFKSVKPRAAGKPISGIESKCCSGQVVGPFSIRREGVYEVADTPGAIYETEPDAAGVFHLRLPHPMELPILEEVSQPIYVALQKEEATGGGAKADSAVPAAEGEAAEPRDGPHSRKDTSRRPRSARAGGALEGSRKGSSGQSSGYTRKPGLTERQLNTVDEMCSRPAVLGERSDDIFEVVAYIKRRGGTEELAYDRLAANPNGPASKFLTRPNGTEALREDVRRCWHSRDAPDWNSFTDDRPRLSGERPRGATADGDGGGDDGGPEDYPKPQPFENSGDRTSKPFPIPHALRGAILEHQSYGKQPTSLLVSTALSAISLAVQGLVDAVRPGGIVTPTSLYILTVANSGERKTFADKAFTIGISEFEAGFRAEQVNKIVERDREIAIWRAKSKGLLDKIQRASGGKTSGELASSSLGQKAKSKELSDKIQKRSRSGKTSGKPASSSSLGQKASRKASRKKVMGAAAKKAKARPDAMPVGAEKTSEGPRSANETSLEEQLAALGPEPKPIVPLVLRHSDTNIQALAIDLMEGHPSVALWSDDAGVVFGANGMNRENFLGFISGVNVLWGAGVLDQRRKGVRSAHVERRRLTVSLMTQPSVLQKLIGTDGGQARGTGFLARFLINQPVSTIGTRFFEMPPENLPEQKAFNRRVRDLLEIPLSVDGAGHLTPTPLILSDDAAASWERYFNKTEARMEPIVGRYHGLTDFASKSAENAIRVAANLHVFEFGPPPHPSTNDPSNEISDVVMLEAIAVAEWYLDDTLQALGILEESVAVADAKALDAWLFAKGDSSPRSVMRIGPKAFRDPKRRDAAIEVLEEMDRAWITTNGQTKKIVLNPKIRTPDAHPPGWRGRPHSASTAGGGAAAEERDNRIVDGVEVESGEI